VLLSVEEELSSLLDVKLDELPSLDDDSLNEEEDPPKETVQEERATIGSIQ